MNQILAVRRGDGFLCGGTFCAVEAIVPATGRAFIVTEDRVSSMFVPLDLVAYAVARDARHEIGGDEWPAVVGA